VSGMLTGMGLFGKRRQQRLFELERARVARRMANEDVTVLGEELSELHYDTLTTELKGEIGDDYAQALDAYDRAKQLLRTTEGAEVIKTLLPVLEDGRFHLACVLARQEGRPLPQRLPSCYFNSQHGPSHAEVEWAPPGGETRTVPVCLTDLNRLEAKRSPAVRMIRVGEQTVPWFAAEQALGLLDSNVDVHQLSELHAQNHNLATMGGLDVTGRQIQYGGGYGG
jgi:hypothetical protein